MWPCSIRRASYRYEVAIRAVYSCSSFWHNARVYGSVVDNSSVSVPSGTGGDTAEADLNGNSMLGGHCNDQPDEGSNHKLMGSSSDAAEQPALFSFPIGES